MNYTIVKQFSNNAIDNIYNFAFKIVDFGKILYEALWGFMEIWVAFYLIFYNFFMYFYYLLLYFIDRGADESRATLRVWRKTPQTFSTTPSVKPSRGGYSPVPGMYGGKKAATTVKSAAKSVESTASKTVNTAKSAIKPVTTSKKSGGKAKVFKTIFEAIVSFFSAFGFILLKPFKALVNFFQDKMKPVREETSSGDQSGSLIESYLKEYEKKRSS